MFTSAVTFFSYANQAHRILELGSGASSLKYFFIKTRYGKDIQDFTHKPLKHPVIVLIDNDDGAKEIFKTIKDSYGISIKLTSLDLFFHVTDNLKPVRLGSEGSSLPRRWPPPNGPSRICFGPWAATEGGVRAAAVRSPRSGVNRPAGGSPFAWRRTQRLMWGGPDWAGPAGPRKAPDHSPALAVARSLRLRDHERPSRPS